MTNRDVWFHIYIFTRSRKLRSRSVSVKTGGQIQQFNYEVMSAEELER